MISLKALRIGNERGYIFIMALLAMLIMASLGILIFDLTTKDVRTTIKLVGEKKAVSAAENGMQTLLQAFNPQVGAVVDPDNACPGLAGYYQVSNDIDTSTCYSFTPPTTPTSGSSFFPMGGYSISGWQQWGLVRYNTTITGTNTNFMSKMAVDVGIGNGPSESSTTYR